jgi:hypothetical protein
MIEEVSYFFTPILHETIPSNVKAVTEYYPRAERKLCLITPKVKSSSIAPDPIKNTPLSFISLLKYERVPVLPSTNSFLNLIFTVFQHLEDDPYEK